MKFNIGCGWRDFGKDWIHIDGGEYDHLDSSDIFIRAYEDDTADLIYSSHFIEYLDREEVVPLLKRWKEVLKPNGIMRLAVPNFEVYAKLYKEEQYPLDSFLGVLYGKMPMGDETIYHKTVYDYVSLTDILIESVGMRDVREYDWRDTEHSQFDDHSQSYLPHMDKENGISMSLNVECRK
jgi:predicted SAM-dependent methyltransferase|tara:strand:+ start:765 stop:1304 length:540 start_codon:yes stop_codon:yes gene_type:complete